MLLLSIVVALNCLIKRLIDTTIVTLTDTKCFMLLYVGGLKTSAVGCRSSMEEEVPFEAEHVLQELYNLDAVVQGVQAGTWER